MSEKRVVQYDTGRGFYINQYVGGTIVVAIEGRAQVVQQTINGTIGLKFNVADPTNPSLVSDFAMGLKSGSIKGYEVTKSVKTDTVTGETKEITELKFEVPVAKGPFGSQVVIYEKLREYGNPFQGFKDGEAVYGIAGKIDGRLSTGLPGSLAVKIEFADPSILVDGDTH